MGGAQALPHLRGKVLDYGCGLGQMTLAATRAGCEVPADVQLDRLAELVPITGSDIRFAMGSGGQTRD